MNAKCILFITIPIQHKNLLFHTVLTEQVLYDQEKQYLVFLLNSTVYSLQLVHASMPVHDPLLTTRDGLTEMLLTGQDCDRVNL